ncbi:hypothetical protein MIND_00187300 [Mycena indigotica]|uniref:Peptidase A1 domain-containing protein n=1 Tax=Mycena indigotica TaxID=2126181 RepID=A0A8H6T652_9AGAR|nr:uncharacterized protein MIND_00187300 [Mycena indigotica]KAF7311768.1 hypothetical protein MIND_00187300 [Mycena indigotica]
MLAVPVDAPTARRDLAVDFVDFAVFKTSLLYRSYHSPNSSKINLKPNDAQLKKHWFSLELKTDSERYVDLVAEVSRMRVKAKDFLEAYDDVQQADAVDALGAMHLTQASTESVQSQGTLDVKVDVQAAGPSFKDPKHSAPTIPEWKTGFRSRSSREFPVPPHDRTPQNREVMKETLGIHVDAGHPYTMLQFGPDGGSQDNTVRFEADLGSNAFWSASDACMRKTTTLGAMHRGLTAFGFLLGPRHVKVTRGTKPYSVVYFDKSSAEFHEYADRLMVPLGRNQSPNASSMLYIPVTIGVANEVDPHFFDDSPYAGIIGLGRRMKHHREKGNTFLFHVRPYLNKPEMTLYLTPDEGSLVFGEMPQGLNTSRNNHRWHSNIPVQGDAHWVVQSPFKLIDGRRIDTPGSNICIDSGTFYVCLDDPVVKDYYEKFGIDAHYDPASKYWLIRKTRRAPTLPKIKVALGDKEESVITVSTLSRDASNSSLDDTLQEIYDIGSIQYKSMLYDPEVSPDEQVEMLGIAALYEMEINFQFPDEVDQAATGRRHNISWRCKDYDDNGYKADFGLA